MDHVACANLGIAKNRRVCDQPGATANSDAAVDQAEWTDFDIIAEFDFAARDGARMDSRQIQASS